MIRYQNGCFRFNVLSICKNVDFAYKVRIAKQLCVDVDENRSRIDRHNCLRPHFAIRIRRLLVRYTIDCQRSNTRLDRSPQDAMWSACARCRRIRHCFFAVRRYRVSVAKTNQIFTIIAIIIVIIIIYTRTHIRLLFATAYTTSQRKRVLRRRGRARALGRVRTSVFD